MQIKPITLHGRHVRLEPLSSDHLTGLKAAINDGQLWQLMVTSVPHPDDVEAFYQDAVKAHQAGQALAFATINQASNQVVGSTRFMNANLLHHRLEIGFTFIAQSQQRTATNTEAKLLMLSHAFEQLQLNRVEFVTDFLNHRSRQAILRLGAKQEGILRNHMQMPDGRIRDSVVFSITCHEWAGVKAFLEEKLGS